jgi:hypothetical protein
VITLESVAADLADAIERTLPAWVERCVFDLVRATGRELDDEVRAAAGVAGARCVADVGPRVRALLGADIDDQRSNPLALIRQAVPYPTAVLAHFGVPAVQRDGFAEERFPDDVYDLTPAGFADVDPDLHELGLAWGAAKAHTHLRRRREEGLR